MIDFFMALSAIPELLLGLAHSPKATLTVLGIAAVVALVLAAFTYFC